MSLVDKMRMWNDKEGDDPPSVESDGLFEGVADEEDESIDIELLVYRKFVLESEAYKWFIMRLKANALLHLRGAKPELMSDKLRQQILVALPTGTISKRRAPDSHEVTFVLEWQWSMVRRLWGESLLRLPMRSQPLSALLTVTGSPNEAQTLTIKEYLAQTWPFTGPQLCQALDRATENYGKRCPGTQNFHTQGTS
jgi:hypothetical protein